MKEKTGWEFLRPWLKPLRDRLYAREVQDESLEPDTVAVGVRLLENEEFLFAADWRAIRCGMLLLSLLARADPAAWVIVIEDLWNLYSRKWLQQRIRRRERFVLVLESVIGSYTRHVADMLGGLFSGLEGASTHEFIKTVKNVMDRAKHASVRTSSLDVPILVIMEAPADASAVCVKDLLAIRDKYNGRHFPVNMRPPQSQSCALEAAFVIEAVLYKNQRRPLEVAEIEVIESLVSATDEPIPLSISMSLQLGDTVTKSQRSGTLQVYGKLFERLFRNSECPTEKLANVENVRLTGKGPSSYVFARLCTAMAESRIAKGVTIAFTGEESYLDEWMWSQLAYALFSRHAQKHSSITSVSIYNCTLSERHVEAIAKVLRADDPVGLLYGDRSVRDDRSRRAFLKRGTTALIQPIHPDEVIPAKSRKCKLPTDVSGVVVLDDRSKKVKVLLPGYGICLVSLRDLIFEENEERTQSQVGAGVRKLNINFDYFTRGSGAGFPRMLEMIGSTVTHLHFCPVYANISVVFRCCPNLISFRVLPYQFNVRQFVDEYRASNMKIEELGCNFDNLHLISRELCDAASPISRHLKYLTLTDSADGRVYTYRDKIDSILTMLDRNNTLERITITYPNRIWYHYKDQVVERDGKSLPVAYEPFPLQCRIAFLSVLGRFQLKPATRAKRAKKAQHSQRAIILPVDVVAIIFQFAAERKYRQVEFFGSR